MSGTYVLAVRLSKAAVIEFGAAGALDLAAGTYAYVGSAPNDSFARVDRHRAVAAGQKDTRHWHIDYLLGHTETDVSGVWRTREMAECEVATVLQNYDGVRPIGLLGASDCACDTHLFRLPADVQVGEVF